jgi:N4-gp56 family major capsid protein
MITASTGQGTAPILPSYICISHNDLLNDWESVNKFIGIQQYPKADYIDADAEIGSVGRARILVSTQGIYDGSAYYGNLIMGKEAYGKVSLDNKSLETYYTPPGSGDDYLRQREIFGWKMWGGWRIIQDLFIINLRCTKMA